MRREPLQTPGLIPPVREWTVGGVLGGLLLAALVLLPWAFLFVLVWALMATPGGGDTPPF